MTDTHDTSARAAALRDAFDRGFAEPVAPLAREHVDLLLVEIAGEPYAIAQAQVAALHADLAIVPMPTHAPALLGIAAIRAALVPIYDLRALLHRPRGPLPRWAVIARGAAPIGLAFDRFIGHLRSRDRVTGIVQVDGRAHALLELPALLTEISRWTREPAAKEG